MYPFIITRKSSDVFISGKRYLRLKIGKKSNDFYVIPVAVKIIQLSILNCNNIDEHRQHNLLKAVAFLDKCTK